MSRRRRRGYAWPLRMFAIFDARALDSDPDRADRAVMHECCETLAEAIRNAPEYGDGNAIVVLKRTDEVKDGAPIYDTEATLTVDDAKGWRAP